MNSSFYQPCGASSIMDGPLLDGYRMYSKRVQYVLFLGCVSSNVWTRRCSFRASTLIPVAICCVMCCFVLNYCWSTLNNIGLLTAGLSFAGTLLTTTTKAVCFFLNYENLLELHETLDDLFEEEISSTKSDSSTLLSTSRLFAKMAYSYWFLISGTYIMWAIPPIVSIIRQYSKGARPIRYRLPLPGKFPWTIEGGSSRYQAHYLFEVTVGWFLLFTNSGVDSLFGFYAYQISSILRAMTRRLSDSETNDDCAELLKRCVKKHRQLLRCRDIFQNIYGPSIVLTMVVNSVVMCAVIFQCFQKNLPFGKICMFLFYIFMKIVQTFMYAWYGNAIPSESEAFRQGIYFSKWLGRDSNSLKGDIILMMMQKQMTITASRIFIVSFDMFVKVMNTTMSYFFLLQTLDTKE